MVKLYGKLYDYELKFIGGMPVEQRSKSNKYIKKQGEKLAKIFVDILCHSPDSFCLIYQTKDKGNVDKFVYWLETEKELSKSDITFLKKCVPSLLECKLLSN